MPTLNRQDFLLRTISYYLLDDNVHPLYIGDASPENSAKKVTDRSKKSNLIKYYHLEGMSDRDTMIFLANEAQKDGYEYCAFQGDDDFFVVDSLSRAAEFLKDHSEYRTVQGSAVTVELDRPGPFGKILSVDNYWLRPELNKETGADRVKELADNYWVPNFSVHRTQEFIEDFTDSHFVKDRNWGEITNCFSCAIKGKSKYLDIFYLIRNVHSGIEHETSDEWRSSEEWGSSYKSSVLSLSHKLSNHDKIDLNTSKAYVKRGVSRYLRCNVDTKTSTYQSIKRSLSKKKLIYLTFKKIEGIAIDVCLFMFGSGVKNPRFMKSRYSIYHKEFKNIKNVLKGFDGESGN